MSTDSTTPDTIVLIHGLWVTPRSLGGMDRPLREQAGYSVLAPGYPGFEVEVEALNADPRPIEALTVAGRPSSISSASSASSTHRRS